MTTAPKKTSALKIVLIVFAVLIGLGVLGGALCIGSGVYWFQQNAPELRENATQGRDEGRTYAAIHSQNECIDEGFRRHDTCGGGMALACRTQVRVFTDVCLAEATPSAGLCDGVPGATEIMAGGQWAADYCRGRGRAGDAQCPNLVRSIVEHCARVRR
jgi:hypothetical protein